MSSTTKRAFHKHKSFIVMSCRWWLRTATRPFKPSFGGSRMARHRGYPRFKGCHRFHSIGFKEYGNGFRMAGRRLKVSGVGCIAVRWHRAIGGFVPCQIKTLRITHKAGRWYACQSQPSCQKLSDWLAWMSGYPHGSRPAQVRRFKTPTPTGRAKRLQQEHFGEWVRTFGSAYFQTIPHTQGWKRRT